jgi:hypothetical protein
MKNMSPINNSGKKKIIICICAILIVLLVFFVIMLTKTKKTSLQKVLVDNETISQNTNSSNVNPINFITSPQNSSVEDNSIISNEISEQLFSDDDSGDNISNNVNLNVDSNIINNSVSIDNNTSDNTSLNTNTSVIDYDIIAKDKNKVSLEFKTGEISLTGATIIITDKNKSPYTWKPGYKLQIKQDGLWKDLDSLREMSFDETAYELDENGQYEEKIDWANDYGSLEAGSYRIVKTINYNGSNLEFYVEFLVNNI